MKKLRHMEWAILSAMALTLFAAPRVLRAQTSNGSRVANTFHQTDANQALPETKADVSLTVAALLPSYYYAGFTGWRQTKTESERSFEIRIIPKLETSWAISTDGKVTFRLWNYDWGYAHDSRKFSSSVILSDTPVHSDYDALVTQRENGVESWYLGRVEDEGGDLPFRGKRIKWNYFMQPMACIKGRLLLPDRKSWASISYHDPRLIYQQWITETSTGNFEIFAPVGDVTLNFKSGDKIGTLLVKDLKAHETRKVEFSFDQEDEPKP